MKSFMVIKYFTQALKALMIVLIISALPLHLAAQLAAPIATGALDTQRNAVQSVLSAGNVLCGETVSIANLPNGTMDMLQQRFDTLRSRYAILKNSLDPQQLKAGAGQLAELDAGLATIGKLFVIDHDQAALSQTSRTQMLRTAKALNQAVRLWCKKLQQESKTRLQII